MKWLALARPSTMARFRLFCLPHAGLGASVYRSWLGALGSNIDICPVQLPGRESRQTESPFRSMDALADAAAEALDPYLDVPFAFFGHSMGALASFEITRRVESRHAAHLFVSGRRAPHLADRLTPLGDLDDEGFVREIQKRYGGIPAAVLEADDLMALLLPRLRADVATLEHYTFSPGHPLPCSISVFGGDEDATVSAEELEGWREHSVRDVTVRLLHGGHLFLQQQRNVLLRLISADLGLFSDQAASHVVRA